MSVDKVVGVKKLTTDATAVAKSARLRAKEARKERKAVEDQIRDIRTAAAIAEQAQRDADAKLAEELSQLEPAIEAGEPKAPEPTPAAPVVPPKAPEPTPAPPTLPKEPEPKPVDPPKTPEPTPAAPVVPPKAPEPTPKPKEPKIWTRIKTWKFWAWTFAIIGAVLAYTAAAHWAGDWVRAINNRDSGFMVGFWTFVVWTLMTGTGFFLGGCIGERFDKKSG